MAGIWTIEQTGASLPLAKSRPIHPIGRPAHRGTIFRVDYTRFPRAFQDAFAGIAA